MSGTTGYPATDTQPAVHGGGFHEMRLHRVFLPTSVLAGFSAADARAAGLEQPGNGGWGQGITDRHLDTNRAGPDTAGTCEPAG